MENTGCGIPWWLEWMIGEEQRPPTIGDMAKKWKRELQLKHRSIDREATSLERGIATAKLQARRAYKNGGDECARPLVVEIVRMFKTRVRLLRALTDLSLVMSKVQEAASHTIIIDSFRFEGDTLRSLNRLYSLDGTREMTTRMLTEMEKSKYIEESIGEAMKTTSAAEDDDDDKIADEDVAAILKEVMACAPDEPLKVSGEEQKRIVKRPERRKTLVSN